MAIREALQGVTKVRLYDYCIFIQRSTSLASTVFHYFNDNFIFTHALDF